MAESPPAVEGSLRAAGGHSPSVPQVRERADLLALCSTVLLGAFRRIYRDRASALEVLPALRPSSNKVPLERLSQQMDRSMIAAMLEEALSITRPHRVEGSTHCLYERLASARPGSAQQRLYLGECFFDGVQIG